MKDGGVMASLWRYSLRVYALPGVEGACLALQDGRGADVNLLLWCCWLGGGGRSADRRLLRRAIGSVAAWRRDVVSPLRQARRAIKRGVPRVPRALGGPVRAGLAGVELAAEKVEQTLLEACARAAPRRAGAPRALAEANLARYLGLLGGPVNGRGGDAHVSALLAAVTAPRATRAARR